MDQAVLGRTLANQAASLLWPPDSAPDQRVYFLIDTARDAALYPALRELAVNEKIVPLYEGSSAVELAAASPYLLTLTPGGQAWRWLWDRAAGAPERAACGIFMRATIGPAVLRAHLRRLTRARLEDGRVLLFRFYDPRVLSVFAPSCDVAQAEELFGPIESFVAMPAPGRLERYTRATEGVRCDTTAGDDT